jgi:hypothetical protein
LFQLTQYYLRYSRVINKRPQVAHHSLWSMKCGFQINEKHCPAQL